MTPDALRQRVRRYLHEHRVLTLATLGPQGPWAAAVFYARDESALYFVSSPTSRHAVELGAHARVAGTVQEDYADWVSIQGVQLEGLACKAEGEDRALAQRVYTGKFPLIGSLAAAPEPIARALARVEWYKLVPERLLWIDNAAGFGRRQELLLVPPGPA